MNADALQNQQNLLNAIMNNNIENINIDCNDRFQLETLKVSTIKLLLDLGNVNADINTLAKSLQLLLNCINMQMPAGGSKLKNSNKKNNKTKKNIDKY